LTALTASDFPVESYEAAHHVLHGLAKRDDLVQQLQPVLDALKRPEPEIAVPLAAANLLDQK
jgi:hypothetical protein